MLPGQAKEHCMDSPFEGRLIRLRAVEPDDEARYHTWMNDPEVTEYLTMRYPISHAGERKWIDDITSPNYEHTVFAVDALDDGAHIGTVELRTSRPESRDANLGIMIGDKTRWDRGYGTDAMRTLCRYGFNEMNLHRIELDVFDGNDRAVKVYERIGFKAAGRRRDAVFQRGRYHDELMMDLLEGEMRDE